MNKKSNKIIIPILVFAAFVGGSTWTYLVINQLSRGTITSITNKIKAERNTVLSAFVL